MQPFETVVLIPKLDYNIQSPKTVKSLLKTRACEVLLNTYLPKLPQTKESEPREKAQFCSPPGVAINAPNIGLNFFLVDITTASQY